MSFVDDVRNSFDALEFCETVRSGVGEGKTTSERALRDASKVAIATAALTHFAQLAQQPSPDVIGIYTSYSPGASELFTALRAISIDRNVVSASLDCLIAIVRYSLDGSRPVLSLQSARAVVKDIVKTRAVLIYQLFTNDSSVCAKKALELLRLTVVCHPLFAREIINRFNLASYTMTPALCNLKNHTCRVPFLDFLFCLITSNEPEVLRQLSTTSRDVLITCLRTISSRTLSQLDTGSVKKGREKREKKLNLLPSHVQRKELIAAINLLMAIDQHFLQSTSFAIRHSTFLQPIPSILATIAAADIPPLHISPREVEKEQQDLRSTAANLFIQMMKTPQTMNLTTAAIALNSISATFSSSAGLHFVLKAINEQPSVAKYVLEKGNYLSKTPSLSSKWLGQFSIISTCLLKIPYASEVFVDSDYLERCLGHTSHLVRNLGALLTLALCRIIESNKPSTQLHRMLPPMHSVANLVKSASYSDSDVTQKLIASYQRLFPKNTEGFATNWMKISLDTRTGDVLAAESTIRAAINVTPYEAVRKVISTDLLQNIIVQAILTEDKKDGTRLGKLAKDILLKSNLFPKGTEEEIDVYLRILSSSNQDIKVLAKSFLLMIQDSYARPYTLFDEAQGSSPHKNEEWKLSLLSIASVRRLKKLAEKREKGLVTDSDSVFEKFLGNSLLVILSCSTLLSGKHPGTSYPGNYLSNVLEVSKFWPEETEVEVINKIAAKQLQELLFRPNSNWHSSYLRYMLALSQIYLTSSPENPKVNNEDHCSVLTGLAWNEWLQWKRSCIDESEPNSIGLMMKVRGQNLCEVSSKSINVEVLEKILVKEDYLIALCLFLTNSVSEKNRHFALQSILNELNLCIGNEALSVELCRFLYQALQRFMKHCDSWRLDDIKSITNHASEVLNRREELKFPSVQIGSALSILNITLTHKNIIARLKSLDVLKRLSTSMSIPLTSLETNDIHTLSHLIPHSPTIRTKVLSQLCEWSKTDFENHGFRCIPILAKVLSFRKYKTEKEEVGFNDRKVMTKLVQSFHHIDVESGLVKLNADYIATLVPEVFLLLPTKEQKTFTSVLMENMDRQNPTFCFVMFLHHLFVPTDLSMNHASGLDEKFVMESFSLLASWLESSETLSSNIEAEVALETLAGATKALHDRKSSMSSLNVSVMEQILSSLLSKIWLQITAFTTEKGLEDDVSINERRIIASLDCIGQVLGLDLLLDASIREALATLTNSNGWVIQRLMFPVDPSLSLEHDGTSKSAMAQTIIFMIHTAVRQLSPISLNEETKHSLLVLESFLASQLFSFNASTSISDLMLKNCIQDLRKSLRNSGFREHPDPSVEYSPYLGDASVAIAHFDSKRLSQTCLELFSKQGPQGESAQDVFRQEQGKNNVVSMHIPFALQTLILACRQALQAPKTSILDIARVARGGLLNLVICGTSSKSEEVRLLSFASLHLLGELVGPLREPEVGSAAGLYRDRRQLSFLLTLFRNSITDPTIPVLPLFAFWYSDSMRVALNPSHPSNKIVTRFLLRSPVMDTSDALGVLHYLQTEAYGEELRPTRMLALDIITKGTHTAADANVLRRRKIIEMIMMMAGSSMGQDSSLRLKALECLVTISGRDKALGVSRDLISSHGLLSWLIQDSNISEDSSHLLKKLEILQEMARAAQREGRTQYIPLMAETLNTIHRSYSMSSFSSNTKILTLLMKCGASIVDIDPRARHILTTDFANLYIQHRNQGHVNNQFLQQLSKLIVRQQNVNTSFAVLNFLLQHCSSELTKIGGSESSCNAEIERCMIHTFVAESLLAKRVVKADSSVPTIRNNFQAQVALDIHAFPTTWLSLIAVRVIDMEDRLSNASSEILKLANALPSEVPGYLTDEMIAPCTSKVMNASNALVSELLHEIEDNQAQ